MCNARSRWSPARAHLAGPIAIVLLLMLSSCDSRHLRGTTSVSPDGKTYLAVADNNGGGCGQILVGGVVWPHPIGEPGRIEPGVHKISCGGEIEFSTPEAAVFRFNYWGP